MFSATGCSEDYLDTKTVGGDVDELVIFANLDNVKMAVNGMSLLMAQQYLGTQGMNGEGTLKTWYNEYTGCDYQKSGLTGWKNTCNGNYFTDKKSTYTKYPWYYLYEQIAQANRILANIDEVPGEDGYRALLKAQTLTYRAYFYSTIVKFYSRRWSDRQGESRGVILRIEPTTDPMGPASLKQVYAQVYDDLDQAINLYKVAKEEGYDRAGSELYLPNIDVAYAVYSRAALNREDWTNAKKYAEMIISGKNYPLMKAADYKAGFNKPNSEWIWEAYNDAGQTIHHYGFFSYNGSNTDTSSGYKYVPSINRLLIEQIPADDARRFLYLVPKDSEYGVYDKDDNGEDVYQWNQNTMAAYSYKKNKKTTRCPLETRAKKDYKAYLCDSKTTTIYAWMSFKFRAASGHSDGEICLFRTAEMLYNAAEAAFMLGDEPTAKKHLEAAVAPYQSGYTCSKSGEALLDEVKLYRRFDLWGEGFSWFDQKRWGNNMVRKTFAEGGNYAKEFAGTGSTSGNYGPADKNNWCWVIPQFETDYNKLIAEVEAENWTEGQK